MSNGSDMVKHTEELTWVLYKNREEWKDVDPISQDDGPYPIVAISYSEKFKDVYNYFRAVLKTQEKSERALSLTKDALDLNPANYTVWQYRREILKHLNKDLNEELQYIMEMIKSNEKNYQVWHHRRKIVEWMQDPGQELQLTEAVLNSDAKNYHAWQYRQWVIRTFNLYSNELAFVEKLLKSDVRNNSAWNQRYFVLNNSDQFTSEVVDREITFTLEKINLAKNNESAWNYLKGIMFHVEFGSEQYNRVLKFCKELYDDDFRSPYLLAYIIDICEDMDVQKVSDSFFNQENALQLCNLLATELDRIRCQYWNYIARKITVGLKKQ